MPDGTVIQGVPEGITRSQLMERYGKYQAAQAPAQVEQKEPNLFERIQGAYQRREGEAQGIADQFVAGEIGAEAGPEMMLKIAGIGPEATGEVVGSALSGLNDLAFGIPGKAISAGINAFSNLPDYQGRVSGQVAAQGTERLGQQYQQFAEQNPRTANMISAAGEAANLAGLGMGGTKAGEIKSSLFPKVTKLTREQETAKLRKTASQSYKASKAEDLQLADEDIGKLNSSLQSLAPNTDLERRTWSSSQASKEAQEITDSISMEKPSFNGLLAKRSDLNSKIKVAARAGNDAEEFRLNKVKEALDEAMMGAESGTWQVANHQWAQQAVLGDMDEIVNKALTRAQPANSLDTAINNYLYSYKSKRLSDAEWSALKDVTNNSSMAKLKRGAASGLTKYVAGAVGAQGGPLGAGVGYLVGHYGSELAKDAAMAAKVKKLDRFRELILQRKVPEPKPKSPVLMIGDRGQAARTQEALARAQERLDEGRTGGVPLGTNDLGDVPYNYYSPQAPERQKLLPAPGKTSSLPMSEQQINIEQARMGRGNNNPVQLSGSAEKPPVSQFTKLQDTLGRTKGREFQVTVQIFKDGGMSQNQFIKDVTKKFGLNQMQARSLAKEVKTYGENLSIPQRMKAKRGKK